MTDDPDARPWEKPSRSPCGRYRLEANIKPLEPEHARNLRQWLENGYREMQQTSTDEGGAESAA